MNEQTEKSLSGAAAARRFGEALRELRDQLTPAQRRQLLRDSEMNPFVWRADRPTQEDGEPDE